MGKAVRRVLLGVGGVVAAAAVAVCVVYFTRFQTLATVEKVTDHADGYDLYRMEVKYDYSIDDVIAYGVSDDQGMVNAILKEALPFLPVSIDLPDFGCTAFGVESANGDVLMGRNYDFRNDTSAMLVYCAPKDGYRSVAFAALDNLSANAPLENPKARIATLAAPFVCLDGMNEKGVSIAVLTLDSEPTVQSSGKQVIFTTLAIRLVLDRAATTQEAVELLQGYDMLATNGRDYHFFVTDASGDSRIIEYDCESETRELVATPARAATNFFEMYKDRVQPNQKNGVYGHGFERYEAVESVLDANEGNVTADVAWEALRAAAQLPKEGDATSNTQWSIVFDDTALTAQISIRRNWDEVVGYSLTDNALGR